MTSSPKHVPLHEELARRYLVELAEEFTIEMERRPLLAELLALCAWALHDASPEVLAEEQPQRLRSLRIRRQPRASRPTSETVSVEAEILNEFNDNLFVLAGEGLADLARRVLEDTGARPTPADVCALLVKGLHRCADDLVADPRPADVIEITPVLSRKTRRIPVRVGDIVAVPVGDGMYYPACILGKNHFGTAYGFFRDSIRLPHGPLTQEERSRPLGYAIFSTEEAVARGRWPVIDHDETCLGLFPERLEIFHRKEFKLNRDDPAIGPFGSGETADGELRALSRAEAEAIGLLDDSYDQVWLEEAFARRLPRVLAAGRT